MSIYASNKALFELCLDRALEDIAQGKLVEAGERRSTLIEAFNNAIDSLEAEHIKRVEEANLAPPKPVFICAVCATKIKGFELLT